MPLTLRPASPPRQRMLTFSSGGWVLALAGLLMLAVLGWHGIRVYQAYQLRDGGTPPPHLVNGFDLGAAAVPASEIQVRLKADGLRALDSPKATSLDEVHEAWGRRYLVSSDAVIGVRIAGQARAYPLRVLNWHEVVNDDLGGTPIAVTYNGLCDSSVVYDRRLGEETLVLRHSGMIHNSNALLFDERQDVRRSSLWGQLRGRAVSGPLLDRELTRLACVVTTVGDWFQRYPESTIVPGLPSLYRKCYRAQPYGTYLLRRELRFPVDPLPPEGGHDGFEPVVVLHAPTRAPQMFYATDIVARADEEGFWQTELQEGLPVRFRVLPRQPYQSSHFITVEAPPKVAVTYARYFAWYSASQSPTTP